MGGTLRSRIYDFTFQLHFLHLALLNIYELQCVHLKYVSKMFLACFPHYTTICRKCIHIFAKPSDEKSKSHAAEVLEKHFQKHNGPIALRSL